MRIQCTRLGHCYLRLPQPCANRDERQIPTYDASAECSPCKRPVRVIALDPGFRCFATGYDPSRTVVQFGSRDVRRLYRLCRHADRLEARIAAAPNHRKSYSLYSGHLRLFQNRRDLTCDLHWRLAKWSCTNYDVVLFSKFKALGMVQRGKRRIHCKVVRQMLSWAHNRFQ